MASSSRRRLTKDARRAELIAAGEEVFSERPFEEVSIDDIASAARISKNLLYHYFSGKRELFLAVVATAAAQMHDATAPDPALGPVEQLAASLDAHLTYADRHAKGYVALMRGGTGDAELQAIITDARDRAIARLVDSLPPVVERTPELALALRGWIGLVDALTLSWLETRALPQERVRELLQELFVALLTTTMRVASR